MKLIINLPHRKIDIDHSFNLWFCRILKQETAKTNGQVLFWLADSQSSEGIKGRLHFVWIHRKHKQPGGNV